MPPFALSRLLLPLICMMATCGCGRPNQANIELRKQIQKLHDESDSLKQTIAGDQRVIAGMRDNMPSVPVLPSERLDKLFVTRGLKIGRYTAGFDTDPNTPGDEGIKIYVVPIDASGQAIKAAGSFTIEAFDLAQVDTPLIGHWSFDVDQSKKDWYGTLMDYTYAFQLPWQKLPLHPDITLRVAFRDELTQVLFTEQTVVKVRLPVAPAAAPVQ
jgi:hypothetical protein